MPTRTQIALSALALSAGLAWYTRCKAKTSKITLPATPDGRKRTILITGGASGIGFATAIRFLEEGWIVGIYDLNLSNLQNLLQKHQHYNSLKALLDQNLITGILDVTNQESCRKCVQDFLKQVAARAAKDAKLDVLFNCAGVLYHGKFGAQGLDRELGMIRVNCDGIVNMTYCCLEALKSTENSRVVTMASVAAIAGIPYEAVYAATKCFVYSFTESMRSEFGSTVRFTDVSVAYVDTPMVQRQIQENYSESSKKMLKNITAEDVSNVVFKAVHECDYYKVHFYVKDAARLFKVNFFSRLVCEKIGTVMKDKALLITNKK